jgi:hypothetical protein
MASAADCCAVDGKAMSVLARAAAAKVVRNDLEMRGIRGSG